MMPTATDLAAPPAALAPPAGSSAAAGHAVQVLDGPHFTAAPDETLLDAAARSGVLIEHSCRTGRCGSCRVQLLQGRTLAVADEAGLDPTQQAQGWVLACVRRAASALTVAADLPPAGLQLPPACSWPARIHQLQRLADDVLQVQLRLPPGAGWQHLAGQHLVVQGPGGVRRAYSLANAPQAHAPLADAAQPPAAAAPQAAPTLLTLHIRRVPGGAMSAYWFDQARPGDLLRLRGPLGSFTLGEVAGQDLVMLATGTGIAPLLAQLGALQALPTTQQPRSLRLLWGGRTEADLYLDPAPLLAGLPARWQPVLSRAGAGWAGARGHVQQVLLATPPAGGFDWACTRVLACGSVAMVHSARALLQAQGLAARHFRADAFVAS